MLARLENLPLLMELAQMVGVSDRTVRYRFRQLFGTTVFGYLTNKRMEKAEQLLRSRKLTVTEVANLGRLCPTGICHCLQAQWHYTQSL